MAIECYENKCECHASNFEVDSGPYCWNNECMHTDEIDEKDIDIKS